MTASGISRWRRRGHRGDSGGGTAVTSPGTSRRQHRGCHGDGITGDTGTALSAPRPRVTAASHAGISPPPPPRPREPRDGAHMAPAGGVTRGGRELRVPAVSPGRGVTALPWSVGVRVEAGGGGHPDPPPHRAQPHAGDISAQPERAPSGPPCHRHPSVTVTQLRRCRHAVTPTPPGTRHLALAVTRTRHLRCHRQLSPRAPPRRLRTATNTAASPPGGDKRAGAGGRRDAARPERGRADTVARGDATRSAQQWERADARRPRALGPDVRSPH